VLCIDVGSTFTKGALVGVPGGELLATADTATTPPEVLRGVDAVRSAAQEQAGRRADDVLACSSAGGGLRIAVVGYERLVTAEAGRRVALSAGGRVVHVAAGLLDRTDVDALRAARPDVALLVGGTDGGDAEVLLANARRLGAARFGAPIVVAGNAEAAPEAAAELQRRRHRVVVAPNVLPRIGTLEPLGARSAIRDLFLEHVIGGKGLSRGRRFAGLVRAPTPDAVLTGVEVLAEVAGDALVVDVGGATTDVYSVLTTPAGAGAVAGTAPATRTVEGDLGMRWSAPGVVAAAQAEGLLGPRDGDLPVYAAAVAAEPGRIPADAADAELDLRLAELAVLIALRRHGRPPTPTAGPRPLRDVRLVVGSGGVLRHAAQEGRRRVLAAATGDHGGGWRVPERARTTVDARYVLFAAGLLAGEHRTAAAALVGRLAPVSP
jgi:uncharacterized protein (TIGR01319 family)